MVSRSKIRGWVGGKEQIEEKERKYYAKESRGDTERWQRNKKWQEENKFGDIY